MVHGGQDSAGGARGVFITFEGGDGAGKSTHIRFLAKALRRHGLEVVSLREPGGTPIGEKLRQVVLDPGNGELSDESELLVFEAARAQLVSEVIKPALERGAVVLCDRFTDSTLAYQACGRGLSAEFVRRANEFACQGVFPCRTILLVAGGSAASLKRATRRGADRIERGGAAFHARGMEGVLEAARRAPARIRTVESAGKRSDTARAVFAQLADLFPWMADELDDGRLFAQLDRPPRRRNRGGRPARKEGGRG